VEEVIETQSEFNSRRHFAAAPKPARWENLFDGCSWAHRKLGLIKKVRAYHKFLYDYYAWPDEMDPSVKFGPFLKRGEAVAALEAEHERRDAIAPKIEIYDLDIDRTAAVPYSDCRKHLWNAV